MNKITWIVLLAAAGAVHGAAQDAGKAALEGLDPVLLTEDQEIPGKEGISLKHGRFLYQFSTEETRSRFQKDPERYGIQLDGACARMGPPVEGSADAYFVYNHRIYVFGSSECYKRFSADPKKYLEVEHPKPDWNPTAETRNRGKELLSKTISAIGGAEALDRIRAYAETRQAKTPHGELTIRIYAKLPDSLVTETVSGDHTYGSIITAGEALTFFEGTGRKVPSSFGRAIRANTQRDLLPLLLARSAQGFDCYAIGRKGNFESLQVNDQGRISTLLLNSESGRIEAIEWLGASPEGYVTYHVAYSDYRPVAGLFLPFRADTTAEGSDVPPGRSWTVASYDLNPADIEAKLRPSLKIAEQ